MIAKEDLKDWLDENNRKEYAKKLESFIDGEIKSNALAGNTTFFIATGRYTKKGSEKTPFYDLWNSNEISEDNRNFVQRIVIDRYREFGFVVRNSSVDCGWNNSYFALQFIDIHKVLEVESN